MDIGRRGVVWTGSFDAQGIRLAAQKTKDAGFDLIEYPLMDPFSFDTKAAVSALEEFALKASASLGLSEGTDVSSSDPQILAAGEQVLMRAVDVLADMRGTYLTGVIYSAMSKYMAPATEAGLQNFDMSTSARVTAAISGRDPSTSTISSKCSRESHTTAPSPSNRSPPQWWRRI